MTTATAYRTITDYIRAKHEEAKAKENVAWIEYMAVTEEDSQYEDAYEYWAGCAAETNELSEIVAFIDKLDARID